MKHVDILIQNGTVVTMDEDLSCYSPGAVAVCGDIIVEAGAEESVLDRFEGKKVIDAHGGIIMPGLINAHTHAAMTCFRGLADDLPLMTWLNEHIFPAESTLSSEMVYSGTLLACAEMILSGATTFCDMYLFEDSVAKAARRAGMRALVGEVLYDFPSPNYGPIEKGFEYTAMLIDKWKDDPLVSIAVEPHSTYLCSPDLLQKAQQLCVKHDVPLVIHLAETAQEVSRIRKEYGLTPVGHLADLHILGPHLIADHCVALTHEDKTLLKEFDVKVVHNPESNMKLASGIAPIPELIDNGVTVGIGTDGCASNNNLDLLGEMDCAAKLHKVNLLDPTVMDARTVVKMATIEGARVLGMDAITGSLVAGKKADVIIIDIRKPHLTPMYNIYSHLVYAVKSNDVSTAIIDGRIVMEERALKTLDAEETMAAVNRIADERLRSFS
ncbi:MAG: amidohydrolase [Deltaproteobacteria bacterium]|nr:amidohydrolase [Deltaproteobacteria bacterium]